MVRQLGKFPLPVEVIPYGHEYSELILCDLGAITQLRKDSSDRPFITDSGNYIFDCKFPSDLSVEKFENKLSVVPGVVASGLFTGFIDELFTIQNGIISIISTQDESFW